MIRENKLLAKTVFLDGKWMQTVFVPISSSSIDREYEQTSPTEGK